MLYMAVPRLAAKKCFWRLNPSRISKRDLARAATIRGASTLAEPVGPRELPHIDLVVAGSVAVNRKGARIGKGGGYSDLEYAIGREIGAIDGRTKLATTIHPLQLVEGELPVTAHDFFLDLVITPEEVLRPRHPPQPRGILRRHLSAGQREQIPVLRELGIDGRSRRVPNPPGTPLR
jgi:5-formyltetrahydrofolate cyclo-ligase